MIVSSVIWRHYHRKRKAQEFLVSVGNIEIVDKSSVLLYSMNLCCATLGDIINTIIIGDKIQICQKHRLFAADYDKFEHFSSHVKDAEVRDDIYLKYLWEATLKIAESGRNMVIHPEFNCKAPEIRELVFWTYNLPDSEYMELSDIAEKCKLNKEKISEIIRNYSDCMSHKDYEDGSQKYSYLLFLHYLHSFMMSLDNLTKSYRAA